MGSKLIRIENCQLIPFCKREAVLVLKLDKVGVAGGWDVYVDRDSSETETIEMRSVISVSNKNCTAPAISSLLPSNSCGIFHHKI